MTASDDVDLRRVILQTLESWHASGISHLTASQLPRETPAASPAPASVQPTQNAGRPRETVIAPTIHPSVASGETVPPDQPPHVKSHSGSLLSGASLRSSPQPTPPQPVQTSPSAAEVARPTGAAPIDRSGNLRPPTPAQEKPPRPSPDSSEVDPAMPRKPAAKSNQLFESPTPDRASSSPQSAPAWKNLPRDARVAELKILSERVAQCTRCSELAATRTQTVFGVGNPEARVVFVGEAPGADEDAQGEPFVGRAGQLLNKIIEAMKLKREEIYICNVLRCRPPGNRLPAPAEAHNCREYLDGQLALVNPEYIVCWGSCASQNLLGVTESIGKMRGRFYQYGGARVLCTYHPSYLLRNPAAKKDVWEDMKILMREMGIPID